MKSDSPTVTLPQLETIRVLAMGAIFLFHLWSVVPDGPATNAARTALGFGYLGVVVFNMITGLVLALPTLGPARRRPPGHGEFLRHRFLRIVPHYYVALGLWAVVARVAADPAAAQFLAAVAAHVLFVHTLSPATFFAIVPAYWWLGPLAQLYLVFPLVLRVYERLGAGRATLMACALGWGTWGTMAALAADRPGSLVALVDYMGYYNLPYRLPEFAIGMGIASCVRREGRGPAFVRGRRLATGAVVGVLLAVVGPVLLPAGAARALPVLHARQVAWCLAAVVALLHLGPVARIGRWRTVARLSTASYSFYLLHQPILGYGAETLAPRLGQRAAFWLLLVGGGLLSFVLSLALDGVARALGPGRPPAGGAGTTGVP